MFLIIDYYIPLYFNPLSAVKVDLIKNLWDVYKELLVN